MPRASGSTTYRAHGPSTEPGNSKTSVFVHSGGFSQRRRRSSSSLRRGGNGGLLIGGRLQEKGMSQNRCWACSEAAFTLAQLRRLMASPLLMDRRLQNAGKEVIADAQRTRSLLVSSTVASLAKRTVGALKCVDVTRYRRKSAACDPHFRPRIVVNPPSLCGSCAIHFGRTLRLNTLKRRFVCATRLSSASVGGKSTIHPIGSPLVTIDAVIVWANNVAIRSPVWIWRDQHFTSPDRSESRSRPPFLIAHE